MRFIILLTVAGLIWADGGFIPPKPGQQGDYEIYSSDQVAIIKMLSGSEELSILVKAQWRL